jgi:hypothetical protein
MLISAFGIMLLFAANQSTFLVLVPYPPFGLVTVSFMGLASYLFYLGIYSASVSVSEDLKRRQSIRTVAIRESTKFLDSIGTAEIVHEIDILTLDYSNLFKYKVDKSAPLPTTQDICSV